MKMFNLNSSLFCFCVASQFPSLILSFHHGWKVLNSPIRELERPSRFRPRPLSISLFRETSTAAALDWSFLDGVYLITCPNADPNGERIERTRGILESVGLADKLEVKEFDTDDEDRIRGCYTSHISVIKDILEEDAATKRENDLRVLILEDNLALSGPKLQQATIDSISDYTQRKGSNWDMIHLSYIPYVPNLKISKTESKGIVKLSCGVGSALGTTAYIINRNGMKEVLQEDQVSGGFSLPIPDVMAKIFPESRYAVDPTIFVRAPNTKSLVNPQLDDLRSVLFQPSVAAFSQRLLVATGLNTNALLPLVVVVLLALAGASALVSLDAAQHLLSTGTLGGPVVIPLISSAFSLFSLFILAKGAMLAPKQHS